VKRAVVLVPGIHTTKREADAWKAGLEPRILVACPDVVRVLLYTQGWISAFAIRVPWIGAGVRRRAIGRFQRWVAGTAQALKEEFRVEVQLDAIGYSFGSYLVGHSMSDAPGPRSFWGRVALMGSILSSRDDWSARAGHYQQALNIYSPEDDVVHFSTFGQSGWAGFRRAPAIVRNREVFYEHGDYQRPGPAWKIATDFLALT